MCLSESRTTGLLRQYYMETGACACRSLKVVKIQALRIAFVIVRNNWTCGRPGCNRAILFCLLQLTFRAALRLLCLLLLARTLFLSFGKCGARVSPHRHSSRKFNGVAISPVSFHCTSCRTLGLARNALFRICLSGGNQCGPLHFLAGRKQATQLHACLMQLRFAVSNRAA